VILWYGKQVPLPEVVSDMNTRKDMNDSHAFTLQVNRHLYL